MRRGGPDLNRDWDTALKEHSLSAAAPSWQARPPRPSPPAGRGQGQPPGADPPPRGRRPRALPVPGQGGGGRGGAKGWAPARPVPTLKWPAPTLKWPVPTRAAPWDAPRAAGRPGAVGWQAGRRLAC